MRLLLLNISDIHVGTIDKQENEGLVLSKFIVDVEEQIRKLHYDDIYVIISGDLVFAASKDSYEKFDKTIVQELIRVLGIDRSHFVIAPGNHDLKQSFIGDVEEAYLPIFREKTEVGKFNDLIRKPALASTLFGKFDDFMTYMTTTMGVNDYSMTHNRFDLNDTWSIHYINSAILSCGGYKGIDDDGHLGVDTRGLYELLNDDHHPKKILMMHHPEYFCMEWVKHELRKLYGSEYALILSGHTHDQDSYYKDDDKSGYIRLEAPQLFSNIYDNYLGYNFIEISDDKVIRVIYREWLEKRNKFRDGSAFTEEDNGIVNFVEQSDEEPSASTSMQVEDKVLILLQAKLNQKMLVYNDQPIVWVNRLLSPKRVDQMNKIKEREMFKEEAIIENPRNIMILSPAQYGLSCYGIHFLMTAWQRYRQFGLFVSGEVLKKNKIEGYLNNQLQESGKDVGDVKWIVVDDWIVSRKDSKSLINLFQNKFPNASVILMSPRIERYFKDNPDISIREEGFECLYMAPLKREGVRNLVQAFNRQNYIEEEDRVLKRVDDDIRDFNMHRTPLNCITLLEVFNNTSFKDNPVNRTEVLEKVLRIIFDNHNIPSYRTSVPDMKDCQFVLGYFCKQMILHEAETFTEDKFKSMLNNFCNENGITLDISYLFELLVANQILTQYGDMYCFRFTYWVYYFVAMQMHNNDDELKQFIIEQKNYIHYPEVLEFYTGKDRLRKDAVDFMCEDLKRATESVKMKVGWPENLNLFDFLKCQQSEIQKEKIIQNLESGVKTSNVPSTLKDSFEDETYDPSRPFDQSVRKFFEDYSVNYMMQSIHIASKTFRNSDYVDRQSKDKLLNAILESWKVAVQILWTIAKPLSLHGIISYDDTTFELIDDTKEENDTLNDKLIRIIVTIPRNIMIHFKNDMYSDKNGKTIIQVFERETDKIKKYLLACVIVMERPLGWSNCISQYIAQVGQNSYYLGNLKDIMLFIYNFYEIDPKDFSALKTLIKRAAIKLETGNNNPMPRDLQRIQFVTEEDQNDDNGN